MATFLLCRVIGRAACLGGRLAVTRVDGAPAKRDAHGLEGDLEALVAEAIAIRARRRAERASPGVAALMESQWASSPAKMSPNDMKGLVGEIVAEAVLVDCGYGEPFYSKWRNGGTSTSRGIDIILRNGDMLSANESKHLHTLRPGIDASRDISAAIVAAFRQSGDRHTASWLRWLRWQCDRAERLGGAMHAAQPGAASLHRAVEILDKALSGQGVQANAVAVFDARHNADAESICDRLGPDTLRGTATAVAAAVAAAVDGLHGATESLIRRYC